MLQPKVSVVVPIYKVEKYLVQCIDSIINQTLKDIEIILVDEGDMDACRFICDHYEQIDKRVKTIHEKNGGYGASVNKGLDLATGEYLAIVESDDFIEPTMYDEMYAYAKKLSANIVKTPYFEYWDKKNDLKNYKQICSYADDITKQVPKDKTFSILNYPQQMAVHASLWSGIYKREWMINKNIRFVQGKGAGYVDVGFRIDTFMNAEDKCAWLNKPFYNYRMTNAESSTNQFKLIPMLNRWKEAHANFNEKYIKTYEKVGPYLFLDEFLNTVGWLPVIGCTDEEFLFLKENLKNVPDYIIKNSPVMKNWQKKLTLQVKRTDENLWRLKENINSEEHHNNKECLYFKLFNIIPFLKVNKKSKYVYIKLFNVLPLIKIKRKS